MGWKPEAPRCDASLGIACTNMTDEIVQSTGRGTPRPFVLLWHGGGPVEDHLDWLCATDPSGNQPLQAWRMELRLDTMEAGTETEAIELPPHRPRYLQFEGELSGNRGSVRRIASGRAWSNPDTMDEEIFQLEWLTGPATGRQQHVRLRRTSRKLWTLLCTHWKGEML